MEKIRVLVVDDEEYILTLLKDTLEVDNFRVFLASNLDYANEILNKEDIDCLVLDVEIGKDNGINFCKELKSKERTKDLSIIIITAKFVDSSDVVKGLDFGADDYIFKPFKIPILIARIKAILRRKKNNHEDIVYKKIEEYKTRYFCIQYSEFKIYLNGKNLNLTKKEFEIFSFLIEQEKVVIEKNILISKIWGEGYYGNEKTLGKHIENIRRKLGMFSICLETIQGIGYRFVEKV